MDVLIGLGFLGLVVWYIYKKVGVAADVNNDGKVDAEDAKVGMDMAAGAEVVVAKAVEEIKVETAKIEEVAVAKYKEELAAFVETETKVAKELVAEVEKVVEEVKAVEAKVEEKVEEIVADVEEVVEEVVQKSKKGRKAKAK